LKRGADGSLGVASAGSSGSSVVFNISTPDVQGFQKSQAQISAMLARTALRGQRNL
jgi:phage-related minor tail protein